jgi:hypothetical protein
MDRIASEKGSHQPLPATVIGDLFCEVNAMSNEFYVYAHRKATTGEIFYIGKGKDSRCKVTQRRTDHWNRIVKKHGLIIDIVFSNLSESEAFEAEVFLISEIGRLNLKTGKLINLTDGGEGISNPSQNVLLSMKKAKEGAFNPRYNSTIHKWVNEFTNEIVYATCNEMRKKTNTKNKSAFYNLIGGNSKKQSHSGWFLNEIKIRKPNHSKSIMSLTSGMVFQSIVDAAKFVGLSGGQNISMCLNGKKHRAGGHEWAYV